MLPILSVGGIAYRNSNFLFEKLQNLRGFLLTRLWTLHEEEFEPLLYNFLARFFIQTESEARYHSFYKKMGFTQALENAFQGL